MANSGAREGDPAAAAKAVELKKELQKLMKAILDEDDVEPEAIERALFALKELKSKKTVSAMLRRSPDAECEPVPEEFKCPLSKELMRDPVIIATGQTYERVLIQKWLKSGNRTCPQTQQVLSHTTLTPNHLVRQITVQWCNNHGINLPDPVQYTREDIPTKDEKDIFRSLIATVSSPPLPDQKDAAKQLRLLTKRNPSYRALFGESPDTIAELLSPLSRENEAHLDLQEDLITTLLNVSIYDSNKKLVAETPNVIELLINALRETGTIETRSNASAALFTLSALDSNKELIGKLGALKPLIELLDEGHPSAMKDAASAIYNLCINHENRVRAVRDGVVPVILEKIAIGTHVNELLSILAMLSTNQTAVDKMGEMGVVPCLLRIIRETAGGRNQENCVAILHSVCFNDRSKLREVREEEDVNRTISKVARNGTSRAKRKSYGILERLNRTVNLTHTA